MLATIRRAAAASALLKEGKELEENSSVDGADDNDDGYDNGRNNNHGSDSHGSENRGNGNT